MKRLEQVEEIRNAFRETDSVIVNLEGFVGTSYASKNFLSEFEESYMDAYCAIAEDLDKLGSEIPAPHSPTGGGADPKVRLNMPQMIILSIIARLFDPLSLIAPVIISEKLILKEVTMAKKTHADEVPVRQGGCLRQRASDQLIVAPPHNGTSDKTEHYFYMTQLLWEKSSALLFNLLGFAFGEDQWERTVLALGFVQRLFLIILFTIFAVAERTFKQRFLHVRQINKEAEDILYPKYGKMA
ncbi:hypothetical protein KR038_002534 [Drosophila bunnanda]|nr:hypothetical protein KR038_002534 [Drosophila bunnanda]